MASSSDDSLLPACSTGSQRSPCPPSAPPPTTRCRRHASTEKRRSSYDSSDTNAEISGCIRYVFSRNRPRSRRHGGLTVEEVFERGDACARRMRARGGLAELLGIADEHEVARGRANRDDVGERHLSGLVDEEVVERLLHPRTSEQPRGAGDELHLARRERVTRRSSNRRPLSHRDGNSPHRRCVCIAVDDDLALSPPRASPRREGS